MQGLIALTVALTAALLQPNDVTACFERASVSSGSNPTKRILDPGEKTAIKWVSSFSIAGCAAGLIESVNGQAVLARGGTLFMFSYDKFFSGEEYASFLPPSPLPTSRGPRVDGSLPTSMNRIQSPELSATWIATWNTPKRAVVGTFTLPHHGEAELLFSVSESLVSARASASSPDTTRHTITSVTRNRNGTAKISYYGWR
jgi:hypothetical protein